MKYLGFGGGADAEAAGKEAVHGSGMFPFQ
jgi:hypothetical protein